MKLTLYQIDAFADKPFQGNPAAVCPLDEWLPDDLMQSISERHDFVTRFFAPKYGVIVSKFPGKP